MSVLVCAFFPPTNCSVVSVWVWRWAGWRGTGLPNSSHETKFSGANGDREMLIFPVQLTRTKLILTFAICDHLYIILLVLSISLGTNHVFGHLSRVVTFFRCVQFLRQDNHTSCAVTVTVINLQTITRGGTSTHGPGIHLLRVEPQVLYKTNYTLG